MAAYFEATVPSGVGVKKSPLFCLHPSFWRRLLKGGGHVVRDAGEQSEDATVADETAVAPRNAMEAQGLESVVLETQRALEQLNDGLGIRMVRMRKEYPAHHGVPRVVAVERLSLTIAPGECFGLLGPNGSGKTTLVNMLCGYFSPDSGQAKVRFVRRLLHYYHR